jgi:hypothetical protein
MPDSQSPSVCGYFARVGGTLLFSGVRRESVPKPPPERYSGGPDAGIPKGPFGNTTQTRLAEGETLLGKYFLQWTIDKAWSYGPTRFWLHTCMKDHPAALPNYLKAGFAIYKEEVKEQG